MCEREREREIDRERERERERENESERREETRGFLQLKHSIIGQTPCIIVKNQDDDENENKH